MSATTMVHVRVDEEMKAKAVETLKSMGLSISDAVRMLLVRVVSDQALPFDVKVPNAVTASAIQELDIGKGKSFKNVKSLMADLDADD